MEKRKKIFHYVFNYYLEKEKSNYESYLEKHPGGSWKNFLFPKDESIPYHIQFAKSFIYYLDQGYPAEKDDIIPAIEALPTGNHLRIFHYCTVIMNLLYETDDNELSALAETTILDLHQEIVLHKGTLKLLYNEEEWKCADVDQQNTALYCSYLEKPIMFASLLYPDFYRNEHTEISDPIFCTFAIQAIFINESFIPHPSYIYKALQTTTPDIFFRAVQSAFQVASLKSDYQAAYDILYSLLHMKMVGTYKDVSREFSDADLHWHQTSYNVLLYKSLMALLCAAMSDLQRKNSPQHNSFRNKAINYAKHVLTNKDIDFDTFNYCILALLNSGCYEAATNASVATLNHFTTTDKENRHSYLRTLNYIIRGYLGILCGKNTDIGSEWNQFRTYLNNFCDTFPFSTVTHPKIDESESDSIICICARTTSLSSAQRIDICSQLICIYHLVQKIKHELWDDSYIQTIYNTHEDAQSDAEKPESNKKQIFPIAYYTTLDNLKYLLEPVYANSHQDRPKPYKDFTEEKNLPKSPKNCLTMMHAHYMNDPREGIALPDALSDWIDQKSSLKNILFFNNSPEAFRERLFDNQFVFLKSFTDIIDQLNMWSMYGSDRNKGSDSNGCCVRISPKTFENMLSISHKTLILRDRNEDRDTDDLRLYRVAYLKDNDLVAPDSKALRQYFKRLKRMILKLNDMLATNPSFSKDDTKIVVRLLQEILTPIIFLFKDASYQGENERRLIVTRSRTKEDMERISKTPQNPPKLYINPYHQVFVDQIILGPKVKEPDAWIPHLQFELTKMWENWPAKNGEKRVPSVRKSSINYRD